MMLIRAIKRLREFNHHRTTDAFFVGYPKTGNTWFRFLIGKYLQLYCGTDDMPLFDSSDALGRCERTRVGPSMQFTHKPLEWGRQKAADLTYDTVVRPFRGKSVVLICRYPLDALVSSWFQFKYRRKATYDGDLVTFIRDPVLGMEKLLAFYNLWAEGKNTLPRVMRIRYEDLSRDTAGQLKGVLEFLGIAIDPGLVNDAVRFSSFSNMKKLEASGNAPKYRSSGLDVFATGDKGNPDAYHVRRGLIGGYREYLSEDARVEFETRVARNLHGWYGYDRLERI